MCFQCALTVISIFKIIFCTLMYFPNQLTLYVGQGLLNIYRRLSVFAIQSVTFKRICETVLGDRLKLRVMKRACDRKTVLTSRNFLHLCIYLLVFKISQVPNIQPILSPRYFIETMTNYKLFCNFEPSRLKPKPFDDIMHP